MPLGVETNGRCTLIQALEVRLWGFFFCFYPVSSGGWYDSRPWLSQFTVCIVPFCNGWRVNMTKRTLGGTSRKRRRTSGFRARMRTKNGQRVLKARRRKGRVRLSVS